MNDQMLSNIRTTDEKNLMINLIEEILENIFKRDQKDYSRSPFSEKMKMIIFAEINDRKIKNDRKMMEKYLDELLLIVKKLPELKLTIAIDPSEDLITSVKNWTSKNLSQDVIIDFETKPEIIGGTIIVSPNGKYANYALSEQIDKFFTEKRQEINALL